jgi:hypothetical protein
MDSWVQQLEHGDICSRETATDWLSSAATVMVTQQLCCLRGHASLTPPVGLALLPLLLCVAPSQQRHYMELQVLTRHPARPWLWGLKRLELAADQPELVRAWVQQTRQRLRALTYRYGTTCAQEMRNPSAAPAVKQLQSLVLRKQQQKAQPRHRHAVCWVPDR